MKIAIICFSLSGNAWKAISMLKTELTKMGQEVQILDMTGSEDIFSPKDISALSKEIKQHDALLIGVPVYPRQLQHHVQDLISALPKPDEIWGRYALPYVCYSGISAGIALKETASLLAGSGRIVPAGMNVSAPHSIRLFENIADNITENIVSFEFESSPPASTIFFQNYTY